MSITLWPKGKPRKTTWRDQEREFRGTRDRDMRVTLPEVTCLREAGELTERNLVLCES